MSDEYQAIRTESVRAHQVMLNRWREYLDAQSIEAETTNETLKATLFEQQLQADQQQRRTDTDAAYARYRAASDAREEADRLWRSHPEHPGRAWD